MTLSRKKTKQVKHCAAVSTPEAGCAGQRQAGAPGFLEWGLLAVVFLAPFVFISQLDDFADLPQQAFIQVTVVFFLLAWLTRGLSRGRLEAARSSLTVPVMLLLLWAVVSLAYAHNRTEGFIAWMRWAAPGAMFVLVSSALSEEKHLDRLLNALFGAGLFIALLGIAQHLFRVSWVPQAVPPAATFANKNMAVHFVVLTVPLAAGLVLESRSRVRDGIILGGMALMVVFLVYTRTRAGWVALAAEGLCLAVLLARGYREEVRAAWRDRGKRVAAVLAAIVFLLMVNVGPGGFKWGPGEVAGRAATIGVHLGEESAGGSAADPSIRVRLALWRNTLVMIREHPWIGLGLGNHKVFYPLYHREVIEDEQFGEKTQAARVHNDLLQAAAELGLVGVGLIAWLVLIVVKMAARLTAPGREWRVRRRALGPAVAMAGFAVTASFSFPLQRAVPPLVLMVLTAVLASLYTRDSRMVLVVRSRRALLCAAVLAAAALVLVGRSNYNRMAADRHYVEVVRLKNAGDWEGVIAAGTKARAHGPDRADVLSAMGWAYLRTGRPREAIEALERVIAAYPNHINALLNIGVAYRSGGDEKRALGAYRRVLDIEPDYWKAHYNSASIYLKQGDLDSALEGFTAAAGREPGNGNLHFKVGIVLALKRRYEEAARSFETTVRLDPSSAAAHQSLGLLYIQHLDRVDEGREHLRKAIELDPGMEGAGIWKLLRGSEGPAG